jgi:hypothetical protein
MKYYFIILIEICAILAIAFSDIAYQALILFWVQIIGYMAIIMVELEMKKESNYEN